MEKLTQIESILEPDALRDLLASARTVAANAHTPYSHFHVGAAVLDNRGRIFSGCNVENASFGLTMCAERNAVGAAVSGGVGRIKAVAVYSATESLTPPCGACRQVLSEFGPNMEVHLFTHEKKHAAFRLNQLLPGVFAFEPGQASGRY